MKTRSIVPSVRFFIALISCCLCFGGVIHANGIHCPTAGLFTPASIGLTQTVVQLPVADAFGPDENPFESLRQPWYIRIWPESRILRILMIGGIVMGIKALFSKKSGANTVSPQQTPPPVQRVAQPPVSPAIPPPPTNFHSTVSGWYYQANGTEVGPFDENALRQLKRAGVISPATFLRPANGGDWTNYASIFGFN